MQQSGLAVSNMKELKGNINQPAFLKAKIKETALPTLQIKTLTYIPASDVRTFDITNPLPDKAPKLMIVQLDTESWTGELSSIVLWSSAEMVNESYSHYSSFNRFPGVLRYYNADGRLVFNSNLNVGANAPGISDDKTTLRVPGHNATGCLYHAGAQYRIRLFYWGE